MWNEYIRACSIDEAVKIISDKREGARIIAGATDLMLEIERGTRKFVNTLVDITSIPELDQIRMDEDGLIHLGPLVTHNACAGSKLLQEFAFPLVRASWEVGSPQIRNRATVAGNIITASPANDTISPLMALDAVLTVKSVRGERIIKISEFYTGVRKNCMLSDEMLVDIAFKKLENNQRGTFIKFALRKAQAISLVNVTVILTFDKTLDQGRAGASKIENAVITLGAVAPIIIHARDAEQYLVGKYLDDSVIENAAALVLKAARPISDIRGSASYRKTIVKVISRRALRALREQTEREGFPESPVLLWGDHDQKSASIEANLVIGAEDVIKTTINGKRYDLANGHGKSLLRLLRENALLTGTKEACAEGECGACTVHMDGKAVLSCMIPAERAHGAEIVTIEGINLNEALHPVQEGFVELGAVQCGYCTPGLVMSAVKLLEEKPRPSQNEIKQAIAGNLCRCTGYYKIIEAIDHAASLMDEGGYNG